MASWEKRQRWAAQARERQAQDEQRAGQPTPISYFKIFLAVLAALLVALWVFRNLLLI